MLSFAAYSSARVQQISRASARTEVRGFPLCRRLSRRRGRSRQAHAAVKECALRAHPWANTTRRFSPDPFSFRKKAEAEMLELESGSRVSGRTSALSLGGCGICAACGDRLL